MTLDEAYERAAKVVDALRPFCSRIAVAGSVRREKPEPNDIEDLFNLIGVPWVHPRERQ